MSATPYRVVSWQPLDLITTDNVGQMSNNEQWLYENTPRSWYTAFGVNQTEGVRIVAGTALITARKADSGSKAVYFGNQFTSGCRPIVTTGINSSIRRIEVTLGGIGQFFPSDVGFTVYAYVNAIDKKKNILTSNVYVHYQALGY